MSSEILAPLADALVAIAVGLEAKGYRWPPAELASLPAMVVELPEVDRTPVDGPEDHLGQKDWGITFPTIFYFDLSVAEFSQDEAVGMVEAFVLAIDADHTLGGICQEAKAVRVDSPEYLDDDERPQIRWPVHVEVLTFV